MRLCDVRPPTYTDVIMVSFALFDTPIGQCGVSWDGDDEAVTVRGVQLPGRTPGATRARMMREGDAVEMSPPPTVQDAMQAMRRLLTDGQDDGLADIPLDWGSIPDFDRRVYQVTRSIPAGRTLTYGEVARRIGEPHAAQAVGQALGRNPVPIVVPCHRVLGADGQLGGFSAPGGSATKRRTLVIEGALSDQPTLFG